MEDRPKARITRVTFGTCGRWQSSVGFNSSPKVIDVDRLVVLPECGQWGEARESWSYATIINNGRTAFFLESSSSDGVCQDTSRDAGMG